MSQKIIDLCEKAERLNYSAKYRSGNITTLPAVGELIVAGDIHGHRRNFEKIVALADLQNNPQTHLVLQEILHGGPEDAHGGCLSFELFFEALKYQLAFPQQVHMILGNHDTAIITDSDVLKSGKEMSTAMKSAMKRSFDHAYSDIDIALRRCLLSQLLAIKCPNRIWVSHSLPADNYLDSFNMEIFTNSLRPMDMVRPESAYLLTWGRRHNLATLETLAGMLDVDTFLLGHQPQEAGWANNGKNLIIIASDHNHGCVIKFDLAKTYSFEQLCACVMPLASIG